MPPPRKASSQSATISKSKFNLSEEIKEIPDPDKIGGSVKDPLDQANLLEKPQQHAPEIQVIPNPDNVPPNWDDSDPGNEKTLEDLGATYIPPATGKKAKSQKKKIVVPNPSKTSRTLSDNHQSDVGEDADDNVNDDQPKPQSQHGENGDENPKAQSQEDDDESEDENPDQNPKPPKEKTIFKDTPEFSPASSLHEEEDWKS